MKKLIFILLLLVTTNLNATRVLVDNSLQTSLTRKDYCFHCEKCGKDFVIPNVLYHENTGMYFYYKHIGYGTKALQPYEDRTICDECNDKRSLTIIGFILAIVFLGGFIVNYFNRD